MSLSVITKAKSVDLLLLLVAFIELQIIAINFKKTGLANSVSGLQKPRNNWRYIQGICSNLHNTDSKLPVNSTTSSLRNVLFTLAPSSSGGAFTPVFEAGGANYSSMSPNAFWGDHPYADNRRQLIQDCIDILHTELKRRGFNVG